MTETKPEVEFYRVGAQWGRRTLTKLPDVSSPVELGEGYYVAKPVQGQGCWMDAVSFKVLPPDIRLWEGIPQ